MKIAIIDMDKLDADIKKCPAEAPEPFAKLRGFILQAVRDCIMEYSIAEEYTKRNETQANSYHETVAS